MNWLKELIWKLRNPLSFKGRAEVISEYKEGKKRSIKYKEVSK